VDYGKLQTEKNSIYGEKNLHCSIIPEEVDRLQVNHRQIVCFLDNQFSLSFDLCLCPLRKDLEMSVHIKMQKFINVNQAHSSEMKVTS